MNVAAFLARHPPFDSLDQDRIEDVAQSVRIEFFPAGSTILEEGGPPADYLYVIRSGAVEILERGSLVDLAGEGEAFGALSLISGAEPIASVRAHEDTLCYLIPPEAASEPLSSGPGLSLITATLRRAGARATDRSVQVDPMQTRVRSLVRRAPVTFPSGGTIAEAAKLMAEERVSSLLVPSHGGLGILTDRDLRTRILAAGRSPDAKVEEVMSFPARTVPPDAMAGEVLLAMLDGGFHHFPVADRDGQLLGVVTDTDLLGLTRESPFALKSAIERSPDEASAIAAARRLPETAASLVETDMDPVDVGHIVGMSIDTLTRRLLDLAMARHGDPPTPWAWLALGSQARHEQALATDQDHALAYDLEGQAEEDVDRYFAEVAEDVTAGLEAAGIPRCRGNAMAVHPDLRRPVPGWVAQLRRWMTDPGVQGSELTSIAFDFRRIAGPLEADRTLDEVIREAPARYPQFLRHLAHRALDFRPPTGFFRDFVVEHEGEHAGHLDVKHGGILIVTSLARTWAILEGRAEKGTLERLAGAVASGRIDEESRQALEEAFRLLWHVRLDHQATQFRAGIKPDDFVDPASLGPITRRGLKEAFRIITREQRGLAVEMDLR